MGFRLTARSSRCQPRYAAFPLHPADCLDLCSLQDPSGVGAKLEEVAAALEMSSAAQSGGAGYTDRIQTHTAAAAMPPEGDMESSRRHSLAGGQRCEVSVRVPQQAWLVAKMSIGIKAVDRTGSSMAVGVVPLLDACAGTLGASDDGSTSEFDVPMTLGGICKGRLRGRMALVQQHQPRHETATEEGDPDTPKRPVLPHHSELSSPAQAQATLSPYDRRP